MAKQPPPLDDALRAKFEAAREASRIADLTEPRARDAFYDESTGRIVVELKRGASFAFPPSLYPELEGRTPQELARVEVSPSGEGLHWDEIDVHLATAGVLVTILGPSMFRAFASVGGKTRTERKAAAARLNGAKGGRPRKQPRAPEEIRRREEPGAGRMKVADARQPGRDDDRDPGARSGE